MKPKYLFISAILILGLALSFVGMASAALPPEDIGLPCTLPDGSTGKTAQPDGRCVVGVPRTPAPTPAPTNASGAKVPSSLGGSATPSTVNQLVSRVITFLGWIVGVVSVIGVLIGAALYVFSAGDPNRTRVAKDAIVYSIVGLIVAILAYSIVTFVIGKAN